jgi:hypothetical protein
MPKPFPLRESPRPEEAVPTLWKFWLIRLLMVLSFLALGGIAAAVNSQKRDAVVVLALIVVFALTGWSYSLKCPVCDRFPFIASIRDLFLGPARHCRHCGTDLSRRRPASS